MAAVLQALEELARLAELLGLGALGEVAADDDEVGFQLVDAFLDALDQALVVRAEIPNFIEQKRAEGFGVDVKLLIFMNF
jgi:deferrochelatase/peroxidase EfeB